MAPDSSPLFLFDLLHALQTRDRKKWNHLCLHHGFDHMQADSANELTKRPRPFSFSTTLLSSWAVESGERGIISPDLITSVEAVALYPMKSGSVLHRDETKITRNVWSWQTIHQYHPNGMTLSWSSILGAVFLVFLTASQKSVQTCWGETLLTHQMAWQRAFHRALAKQTW